MRMKNIVRAFTLWAVAAAIAVGADQPETKANPVEALLRKEGSYEYNLVGKRLLRSFDAELLTHLAKHPEENEKFDYQLVDIILRAAVEKNAKFQYLLKNEKLRKDYEAALLAYDYNLTGNHQALETLLARFRKEAKERRSWELAILGSLSAVNEWKLIKDALGSVALSADGAGGDGRYAFWLRRRYFFPDNKSFPADYQTFCKEIDELQGKTAEQAAIAPKQEQEGK